MASQPQNPEFRNNPENFHLCISILQSLYKALFGVHRNGSCYK